MGFANRDTRTPELMRSLARRIVDGHVLHLIKMLLECAVEDTDDKGRKRRTTEAKDSGHGMPQGSPISPLLANLSLRWVDALPERWCTTVPVQLAPQAAVYDQMSVH